MRAFVTGGAGFIGSQLVDRLLARGDEVVVYDNLSTGQRRFLGAALTDHPLRCQLVEADILDRAALERALDGCELVFHLAANADVRRGTERPQRDLEQNTVGTSTLLEAMRARGVRRLAFASTGAIYGEPAVFPTPEDAPLPVQTSLYGASKLAAEGMISAYAFGFGFEVCIFRFVSILGPRYSHGHVYDFVAKLLADPHEIEVLGDGRQRKSYLHVDDCVDGMLLALERSEGPVGVFNLGHEQVCRVDDSLGWICAEMGARPRRRYTGGERGWVGDSPLVHLDCGRLRALGWAPTRTIEESVVATTRFLLENRWLFEARG